MMKQGLRYSLCLGFLITLGGCSVSDISSQQDTDKKEVTSKISSKKYPLEESKKATLQRKPVKVVKPYKPTIRPYVDSKPTVNIPTNEEQTQINKELIEAKKKAEEDNDPYASIPDSGVEVISSSPKITSKIGPRESRPPVKLRSSSAVKSLMKQARAEMLIGKHSSAESKLERGLRIEAENPQLWSLLAKAHYGQSNYGQTINMARKAIQFSRDDDVIASNWQLIKEAGEKSGDAISVKDALNYIKMNP